MAIRLAIIGVTIAVGLYYAPPAEAQMHGASPHHSSSANVDHLSALDAEQVNVNRLFNEGLDKLWTADEQGAVENFGQVIALNPRYEDAYISRGNIYQKLGNYQGAIADYTQAIQINPSFTYLHNSLGRLREDLQDYPGAIDAYTEAIRLYPEQSDGYSNLGSVYYKLGQYQAALITLVQAVQVNPGSAASYLKRGEVYAKLDENEKAIGDFRQATNLFLSQGKLEDYKRSNRLMQELQEKYPNLKPVQ